MNEEEILAGAYLEEVNSDEWKLSESPTDVFSGADFVIGADVESIREGVARKLGTHRAFISRRYSYASGSKEILHLQVERGSMERAVMAAIDGEDVVIPIGRIPHEGAYSWPRRTKFIERRALLGRGIVLNLDTGRMEKNDILHKELKGRCGPETTRHRVYIPKQPAAALRDMLFCEIQELDTTGRMNFSTWAGEYAGDVQKSLWGAVQLARKLGVKSEKDFRSSGRGDRWRSHLELVASDVHKIADDQKGLRDFLIKEIKRLKLKVHYHKIPKRKYELVEVLDGDKEELEKLTKAELLELWRKKWRKHGCLACRKKK